MKKEAIQFPSCCPNAVIEAVLFLPEGQKPVAVVQLVHGMREHFGRYERFARFLTDNGFLVAAHNHLGHGGSLLENTKGYFGEKHQIETLVTDMHTLRELVQVRWPGVPYFMFGHSMGSLLTRVYITQYGEGLQGVVLSGTSGANPMATKLLMPLSKWLWKMRGGKHISTQLDGIFNGVLAKSYRKDGSANAWISSVKEEVERYDKDKGTQFSFTVSAYYVLCELLARANDPNWAASVNPSLPLLLLSGEGDPVGDFGRGVREVYDSLSAAGHHAVLLKLYPGGRHEMLNERDGKQVMQEILQFLQKYAA